ncbi:MAG TPA: hypothetical protein VF447_00010 [Terriglobales bacterium]
MPSRKIPANAEVVLSWIAITRRGQIAGGRIGSRKKPHKVSKFQDGRDGD